MLGLMTAAFLALNVESPFRTDAQEVFSGCQASQNGPNGRFYGCPDWNSSITALVGETYGRDRAVELTRSTIRATLPGKPREKQQLKLKGSDFPVLVFVPADRASAGSFGFAEATMQPSAHGMRLLSCVSQTDGKTQRQRCWKALEYLAMHGPPDGAEIDAHAPIGKVAILSHRLEVPADCRVEEANEVAGRIQCEGSMLSWNTVEKHLIPSTGRWLDETLPSMMSVAGGGFSQEHLPCRVERVSSTCARLTKQLPPTGTFVIYVGTAVVEDYAVMITCAFRDEGKGFASVCNNTLSLR